MNPILAAARPDHRVIVDLIEPGSRVLDLGCGNGELLGVLRDTRDAIGYGVELSQEGVMECISQGISVTQADLDEGLVDYGDKTFDYVILNQTIQVVNRPSFVLDEVLRVGKRGIITFPNFANWEIRLNLLFNGRMPKSEAIPFDWYDTPNIHLLTIRDFQIYCKARGYRVLMTHHVTNLESRDTSAVTHFPNLFAGHGFFVITKE